MNFPIQFGLPQIILLLLALGGFALFVHAAHSLLRGEKHYGRLNAEEKEIYYKSGHLPRHKRLRLRRGMSGVLMIILAISLLWLTFLVQAYLGLTSDIVVARVKATSIANSPTGQPMMSIDLTLYDQNGHTASEQTYLVLGNEWMLQDDTIKIASWLNVVGLHSGYKVTRLEGRYDDPKLERNATHTVVELNGGDDGFFQHMHDWHGWISPFIDAQYGTAVFSSADGTYDVYVSQTGLYDRKVNT
ncbi:MAG: hypothetical protein ABI234_16920 [Ktedonobacteraceae bacterium]